MEEPHASSTRTAGYMAGILLLAVVVRFLLLSEIPAGFFRDEADKGYTTYSLVQTGQDQAGERYPVFVRSLSVTTSSLYQYLLMPFVEFGGLNEFTVRLPAALAGSLSVVVTFFLARLWFGTTIALWVALFVAVSPWSVLLSRWANQSILLTLWIPLGVLCFAQGMRQTRASVWMLGSALAFLLALYTYAPARLIVPLMVVAIVLAYLPMQGSQVTWNRTWLLNMMGFSLVLLIGVLPMASHVFLETEASTSRLRNITIFDGQPMGQVVLEWMGNYLLHLSPGYLFVWGDANLRHSVGGFGQLQWMIAPLLGMGIVFAALRRRREDLVLLVWFFLFPVAAACTRESIPHGLRSVFAVPVVHLLAGLGLQAWQEWLPHARKYVSPGVIAGLKVSWLGVAAGGVLLYFATLFLLYPIRSAPLWEYGYRESVTWWLEQRGTADETVVSGLAEYPYIFFLFYSRYDPQRWIDEQQIEGVRFLPVGNRIDSEYRLQGPPVLYMARPDELRSYQAEQVIFLPGSDERRRQAIWKWVRGGSP